jgi:hypothetical protein
MADLKIENKELLKEVVDLQQKKTSTIKELEKIEEQKKEFEKELKRNINSIKKERRPKEQYLLFFRQTLPVEEIKNKCKEIDKSKSREFQLREAYKQLKRKKSEENRTPLMQILY